MELLFPVLAIGGMGVIFGILLAVASKLFEVKKDERIPKISEILPGANCGGCGYAGCLAYAEAMTAGEAPVNCCPSCNQEKVNLISEILGVEAEESVAKKAFVMCSGKTGIAMPKYIYDGAEDCHTAARLAGGHKACSYACIGLGSCVKKCKFNAISVKDGIAVIDREKCVGCGVCVDECPKAVIKLLPENTRVQVLCSSKDTGKQTRRVCSIGCIGCGICVKNCPQQAIELSDNKAFIDSDKCVNCGICAEKCPQKIIFTSEANTPEICVAKKAKRQ